MHKVNRNIPMLFEKVEDVDTRFQKVKIWLMHTGKNYNKSIFTKEAVVEAMNSLKNTPILGYIEEGKLGDIDFRGHESKLVVKDGEYEFKYIGQAYGVIPSDCNPRFETKIGDYGQELEYLVVDGLMWTKFDDAVEILNLAENGEVSQSMELHHEYDGYFDDEDYFVFTKFKFYGACMLGKDVSPAMQKASVEMAFSKDEIMEMITQKLEEYSLIFNKKQEEVYASMELEKLLEKYSVSVEDLSNKGIIPEEFSIEELEVKIQEAFSEEELEVQDGGSESTPEAQEQDFVESVEEVVEVVIEEPETQPEEQPEAIQETVQEFEDASKVFHKFALSHDDVRNQLWTHLYDYVEVNQIGEKYDFWISKVYDNYIIIQNEINNKLFKVDYSKDNDTISLGVNVEVFASYLTAEERGALELMRSNFSQLEEENKELKEFKSDVLKAQHEVEAEKVFSNFSKLEEEDLSDIRENVHNFSIEEIETKLFEKLGRKMASFSKSKEEKNAPVHFKIDNLMQDASPVDKYFKKHGINK